VDTVIVATIAPVAPFSPRYAWSGAREPALVRLGRGQRLAAHRSTYRRCTRGWRSIGRA